jgi:hypothetical protein
MSVGLKAHGLRRAKMQHRVHEMGHDLELVMQTSQIRTVAVGRRYVDQIQAVNNQLGNTKTAL